MRPFNPRLPVNLHLRAPAGRSRYLLFLVAAYASAGCRCERDERKPYTPFGVASSPLAPVATVPATSPEPTSTGVSSFQTRASEAHAPPAAKLTRGSVTYPAPDGRAFLRTIIADFDDNGTNELVGWVAPGKTEGATELWLIPAAGSPKKLKAQPGFVPTGIDCAPDLGLEMTGPATLTYRVTTTCQEPLADRVPSSALGVVAPLETRAALVTLRLSKPPRGVQLKTRVDSSDRDGDGHDDVSIRLTVRRKGSQAESSAVLAWLDRTSGLSRQLRDTEKSFSDIGSVEVVRARGKKTGAKVFERLASARQLFSYLCKESGTYGVTLEDGSAIGCGRLSLARDFFARAEVSAALTLGNVADALAALRRADWFGGEVSKKQLTALEVQVAEHLASVSVVGTPLTVRARQASGAPRYSPLSFDSSGGLLIQTVNGISRYSNGLLTDATDEVDAWPLIPKGPSGERTLGATFPCSTAFVGIAGASSSGKVLELLSTQWPSPRPGRCSEGVEFSQPSLRIIGWGGQGLSAQLDLSLVGKERTAGARGSPLSPNGETRIAQTAIGLVVQHKGKNAHWRADGSEAWSECVIGNRGVAAACLAGDAVIYITQNP